MGSWDQSLTLYNLGNGASGAKEGKRLPLSFDPLSIKYVPDGEFLLVAGTGTTHREGTHERHRVWVLTLQPQSLSAVWCVV